MGNPFSVSTLSKKLALISRWQKDLFKLDRKVVDNPPLKGKEQTWELRDHYTSGVEKDLCSIMKSFSKLESKDCELSVIGN